MKHTNLPWTERCGSAGSRYWQQMQCVGNVHCSWWLFAASDPARKQHFHPEQKHRPCAPQTSPWGHRVHLQSRALMTKLLSSNPNGLIDISFVPTAPLRAQYSVQSLLVTVLSPGDAEWLSGLRGQLDKQLIVNTVIHGTGNFISHWRAFRTKAWLLLGGGTLVCF